jgi:hypothetical protein
MLAGALFAFVVLEFISEGHTPFFFLYASLAAMHWYFWVAMHKGEAMPFRAALVSTLATVGTIVAHFVMQPYLGVLFLLLYGAAALYLLRALRAAK